MTYVVAELLHLQPNISKSRDIVNKKQEGIVGVGYTIAIRLQVQLSFLLHMLHPSAYLHTPFEVSANNSTDNFAHLCAVSATDKSIDVIKWQVAYSFRCNA